MQASTSLSVRLREWDNSDFPAVWRWIQQYPSAILHDYGPQTEQTFIREEMDKNAVRFGVWRDGMLGGLLIAERITPMLVEAHCYFKRGHNRATSFWGRDTTVPALMQGIAWAWHHGYEKITSPVFEHNRLMIGLLEQLGAVREGRFVGHTKQKGKPINVIFYSLFKEV